MEKYDVIIIGAGPAGYPCGIRCAQKGLKVLIIEKGEVGGICLNKGCIPTKTLFHISEEIENRFGIIEKKVSFSWEDILSYVKKNVISRLKAGVDFLLKKNGIDIIKGEAELIGERTVKVNNNLFEGENIVIATGSLPSVPSIFKDDERVITSDEIWETDRLPKSLAIIGGGAIGCEFASIFKKFGVEISIYEMMENLLPGIDKEISSTLKREFEKRGIRVITGKKIENPGKMEEEKILLCIGRKPYMEKISDIGIETDENGVKVSPQMETNIKNIYAVGDITGKHMFAYVATREGEIAAENIAGENKRMDYSTIPVAIFSDPEVGICGMSEEDARKNGLKVKVGKFPYLALGKSHASGKKEGFVKIIAEEETERIIGIHIIGKGATELVSFSTLAIKNNLKVKDLQEILYCHPTFSEAIMEASFDVEKKSIHLPPERI
ncbi:MAG: dihydrolipoyl dehydrogenase [Candidatus Omnitrophota bacterium]|nr:MAG: dihydrolipoyl dehydrogenase [Candidatus Omnitrophota bacterium]